MYTKHAGQFVKSALQPASVKKGVKNKGQKGFKYMGYCSLRAAITTTQEVCIKKAHRISPSMGNNI